ncbi:Proton pump-interactor 1 [Melia azedarach]|uniref:Proton pump-interactor 1 n=1 Tax=Melia azedarach TaxID=155640 RepID=A0ACC1WTZ6_MELAZ|nr:Proton pump-interactor 1 [Melia azedarach]
MTAEADVHGVEVLSPKDMPNGNANADGSVNGNGNDAVSIDPVDPDLNSDSAGLDSKVIVEESKQSPIIKPDEEDNKIDSEDEESVVIVNENQLNNVENKIEPETEESVIVVNGNQINNVKDKIQSENEEYLVVLSGGDVDQEKVCTGDLGIDMDQSFEAETKSGMQAVKDQARDIVSENIAADGSVDQDQGAVAQNDSSESAQGMPVRISVDSACENDVTDMAGRNPVADPGGELAADSEENPEATVADAQLDSEVVNGSVTEEKEQVLATGNTQDGNLETVVNDLVDCSQQRTELNMSLESAESLQSSVDSEKAPVKIVQVAAGEEAAELNKSSETAESFPFTVDSENIPVERVQVDASQEARQLIKSSDVAECLPPTVDSDNLAIESVKVDASQATTEHNRSSKIAKCLPFPVDFENVRVESVQTIPAAPASISDSVTEPDVGFAVSTVAENSLSCEVDDVKKETGNEKLEMQNSESDSHLVANSNAIEVENGPIGDDKVSNWSNNDARLEIETVDENSHSFEVDDVNREMESGKVEMQSSKSSDSHPVDKTNVIEVENGPIGDDSVSVCPNNEARSEIETAHESIEMEEKVVDDSHTKLEVSEVIAECVDEQLIPADNAVVESGVSDSVEKESVADVKAESEIGKDSGVSCRDVSGEDVVVSESELPTGYVAGVPDVSENGGTPSTGGEIDDQRCKEMEENEEIQLTDGDVKTCQEVKENGLIQFTGEESSGRTCQEEEGTDSILRDETAPSTLEGSTIDASETQNVGPEVAKKPFYFLVKVPRYDDENIREQIKSAQSQVDEKTRSRDAIRDEVQTIRATYKKYSESLEAALAEERAARDLLKSKRQEIDSLQSMITKVKNAISVEDIDGRIRKMEHMIAHETLPLKEEKQFIRDIKQLKQLREQFSSSMGKQDEVQQAFDQKDQIEERMKLLRKEADSLRDNVLKAEAATQAAKKQQRDESEKLKKLLGQFKAADDIRQEAYKHLQNLKKQAYDKNKYFWKYKDDAKQANDLAFKGDKVALQHLCVNQVERVLELWNSNDEFRKEYVNSNVRSTLRRLKTLDGRSLGPDEEPPVIHSFLNDRVAKDNSVWQNSILKSEKTGQEVPEKPEKVNAKPIPEVGEPKSQITKSKRPAKPSRSVNGSVTVSGRDEIEEVIEEEPKRTKEEEELARKAEELRKEEEAAKLKEQRRLEEKAKAKEALERKKRIAEKAQARAAIRAQKEAEQKEKEREKRARKKEKRKAAAEEDTDVMKGESTPSSEIPLGTPQSSEIQEESMAITKRPQKSSQFSKQTTKPTSVPLPLRNRGKRRMQSWMWAVIAALVIFALFLLGNSSFSYTFGLEGFGF